MLCCLDPVGTLEGVPEIGFSPVLSPAGSLKFFSVRFFPNKELEPLGVDGGI